MKRSSDRILTTHVGSLARPHRLLDFLWSRERGESVDESLFEREIHEAVQDRVSRQYGAGIDIVCDGEQSKSSFLTYIADRLTGFSPSSQQGEDLWVESRETLAFPEY